MLVERKIDHLIEAGWQVLLSDFDEAAFALWRKEALKCVTALMGPNHTYTKYFQDFVHGDDRRNLLSGEGILTAVKEQVDLAVRRPVADEVGQSAVQHLLQTPRIGCQKGGVSNERAPG